MKIEELLKFNGKDIIEYQKADEFDVILEKIRR